MSEGEGAEVICALSLVSARGRSFRWVAGIVDYRESDGRGFPLSIMEGWRTEVLLL